MVQNTARRHHYLPQFYLRRWAVDGRLKEFRLQKDRSVSVLSRPPKGCGWEMDLYVIEGVREGQRDIFETGFLRDVDDHAARIFQQIDDGHPQLATARDRSALSRFVLSLFQRDPETIQAYKTRAASDYRTLAYALRARLVERGGSPSVFDRLFGDWMSKGPGEALHDLLQTMMDNPELGDALNLLQWSVVDLSAGRLPLLTSDRPLIINDLGLGHPDAFVALPMSPTKAIFGIADREKAKLLDRLPAYTLTQRLNRETIGQAAEYVYANDESQSRCIANRMGKRRPPTVQQRVRQSVLTRAMSQNANYLEEFLKSAECDRLMDVIASSTNAEVTHGSVRAR